MKVVKVISTKTGRPIEVTTTATQLGQLLDELGRMEQFEGTDWKRTTIFQRDSTGRSTKSLRDESISNESSFTIFISPSEHKGGVYSHSVIREIRTKLNNILNELAGEDIKDDLDLVEIKASPVYKVVLTKEEESDLEEFSRG